MVAAFVILAIAVVVLVRRRTPAPDRAHRGPALVYKAARSNIVDDQNTEDRALALAIASLSPAERKRLLDAMEYASTRLEAGVLPGADDLGEGDPVAELQKSTKKYQPALNAARSLARGRWTTNDLSARAVASCDDPSIAKDETCVPLWGNEAGEASRARFLAWAGSNAAVFETKDPAACAAELRDHLVDEGSAIALVVIADDLALATIPERDALEKAAHRLGKALAVTERKDDGKQLEALGRTAPRGVALSWLEVSPKTVVVVPRLSALTRRGELDAAILRSPACRPERWMHRAGE